MSAPRDARSPWAPATRIEAEIVLVLREKKGVFTPTEIRLLGLLYNDVRARADFSRFFPFDTRTYSDVLEVGRDTLGEALHHLAALGWLELGPRTSRHRLVRLRRLVDG